MSRKRLSARDRQNCHDDGKGVCHLCGQPIQPGQAWEVSHPIPLAAGGKDERDNRRPAHKHCHAAQTAKIDAPLIAKVRRQRQKNSGAARPKQSIHSAGFPAPREKPQKLPPLPYRSLYSQ